MRIGLEEPGPGRGVDHLMFCDSSHCVGIDSSALIPEPLGPRNRDQVIDPVSATGVLEGWVLSMLLGLVEVALVDPGLVDPGFVDTVVSRCNSGRGPVGD